MRVLGRLVVDKDGCRLWPASGVNSDGYAKTTVKGQSVTVYKLAVRARVRRGAEGLDDRPHVPTAVVHGDRAHGAAHEG